MFFQIVLSNNDVDSVDQYCFKHEAKENGKTDNARIVYLLIEDRQDYDRYYSVTDQHNNDHHQTLCLEEF